MIKINLLPKEMQPASTFWPAHLSRKKLGFVGWALFGGISLWLLMANGLQAVALVKLAAEWDHLKPQRTRLEKVDASLNAVKNRAMIIQTLKAPQAQWAPRLNLLSDALVSQLWFTSLEFGTGPAAGSAPLPTGPKPKDSTRKEPLPPKVPLFILKGSALVTDADSGSPVTRYLQRLKEHPDFRRWFRNLELQTAEHRQIRQEEVMDFTILLSPTGI